MTNKFDAIDLTTFDHDSRYKFLSATVVPRPIALVTSMGENGILNAAPFSQFIIIAASPALLGIVVGKSNNDDKDTLKNIKETGQYVINTTSESMADQVQLCAFPFPSSVSEVAEAGFTTLPSSIVGVPRIAEAPVHFECRLHRLVEFGDSRATLVVGEVVLAHAREGLASGHRVEHRLLQPLGRIAGRQYCRTDSVIDA